MARVVRLATRGSELALLQTGIVAALIEAAAPGVRVERVVVRTEGDRRAHEPLEKIGGQGVFVKEIQAAVVETRADAAVHSAKDLPPVTPAGLVLAAIPERADPRDAMVGMALDDLPAGAVVATGSPRRQALLASLRPDLSFVGLRGNMATRLRYVEDGSAAAVVAAVAALERLGLEDRIAERLPVTRCLPQVGQGALAVECRAGDGELRVLLGRLDDPVAHLCVRAERGFLRALGAGCQVPVAAWAERVCEPAGGLASGRAGDRAEDRVLLRGVIASPDGRTVVRGDIEREWPARSGDGPGRGRQDAGVEADAGADAEVGAEDEAGDIGAELARVLLYERGGAAIASWREEGDRL